MANNEITYILIDNPGLNGDVIASFLKLKSPVKEKAIQYYIKDQKTTLHYGYKRQYPKYLQKIADDISKSFYWTDTHEGFGYWEHIANNIEDYVDTTK